MASLAAVSIGAGTAYAEGEWVATPNATGDPAGTWTATPAGPQWTATPGTDVEANGGQVLTPAGVLDTFASLPSTAGTLPVAVPPVAPAAVDVPLVELSKDHPAVKALARAEEQAVALDAELTEARLALDSASGTDTTALEATIADLDARIATSDARIAKLQQQLTKIQDDVARQQAAAAAAAANSATLPGLSYAPVSGTVPVIDANLASQLDAYLAAKGSPLAGLGNVFVYQSTSVGLDPRLLVAISGAETSFGTYGPSQTIHNPFGMGPGIVYPSWADSIASAARNLGGSLYKGSGLVTIPQIQRRWAPLGATNDPTNLNSHWYKNVSKYYAELGGDPNGSVFTDRRPGTAIPVAPGVAPGIQGTVAAPSAYGAAVPVPGGGRNVGPKAVDLAKSYLGIGYVAGGASPNGFDAPGLVQFVYARHGVKLPRTALQQAQVGSPIAPERLAPGDAIFFADRTGNIQHEGMYVGEGLFIHAAQAGDVVKVSSLYEPYYATRYAGARRY